MDEFSFVLIVIVIVFVVIFLMSKKLRDAKLTRKVAKKEMFSVVGRQGYQFAIDSINGIVTHCKEYQKSNE